MSEFGGVKANGFHHRSTVDRSHRPFKGKSKGRSERSHRPAARKDCEADPPRHRVKSARPGEVRLNRSKQLQAVKRAERIALKRVGTLSGPPRLIALVPLSSRVRTEGLVEALRKVSRCSVRPPVSIRSGEYEDPHLYEVEWTPAGSSRRRLLVHFTPRDQNALLDIAKVADLLCFAVAPREVRKEASGERERTALSPVSSGIDSGDHSIDVDDFGAHAVTLLKAQGLVSVMGVTVPLAESSCEGEIDIDADDQRIGASLVRRIGLAHRKALAFRRTAARYFHTAFGDECKVQAVEDSNGHGAAQLLRWWTDMKMRPLQWRESRTYMLMQRAQYNAVERSLCITGYLRGSRPVSARQLVHLTGIGDYQLSCIDCINEPAVGHRIRNELKTSIGATQMDVDNIGVASDFVTVSRSLPNERESLVSLNVIDPLANEQSFITEEEMNDAEQSQDGGAGYDEVMATNHTNDHVVAELTQGVERDRPREVQSVWNDALELSDDEQTKLEHFFDTDGDIDEDDLQANNPSELSHKSDNSVSAGELKQKLEREEVDFPDEVSYSMDIKCRERFARYRGLKSFKTSSWDVRENLPLEYARIFQFADFRHSRALALRSTSSQSLTGDVVAPEQPMLFRLHLEDIDPTIAEAIFQSSHPLCVFFLLPHEHKVSVAHFLLQRYAEYEQPVKNKERMEFHCGFRRFLSSPIYSHHKADSDDTKTSRSMVERYLHADRFSVASVYQRIMYPPAPVLAFIPRPVQKGITLDAIIDRQSHLNSLNPIVSAGTLLTVDPDRLLLKRVILTGQPISTHKRHAVVRHMFFNAPDVTYFKPVELHTKMGLVGHIVESHGTKGHMRCVFDGHIKQNDTVCLSLYKRQYPKFELEQFGDH